MKFHNHGHINVYNHAPPDFITFHRPWAFVLYSGEVPFLSLFKDKKGKGAGYPAKESHKLPQKNL